MNLYSSVGLAPEFLTVRFLLLEEIPLQAHDESTSKPQLREVIVSHGDENGILQLSHMQEDGSNKRQLTHSDHGCRMPAWSPNRSESKLISRPPADQDADLKLLIEQKIPTYSSEGKWIAHWEGV